MYNFDLAPDRKNSNCFKWDYVEKSFKGENLLPMWIADMDFKTAPQIMNSIKKLGESDAVFGYGTLSNEYYESVINWLKKRHNFDVKREWIVTIPGVVTALCYGVQIVSEVGDEIIVPTPVYTPFYRAVTEFGRIAVSSSLILKDGRYTFNYEDIESKITDKTKAIMLCSPHNPTGRVWDRDELIKIADICQKHNLYIIDDEIHNDLVFKKHTILADISQDAADRSIVCTAPSKTFNIAGIPASNIIIKNEELRNKFQLIMRRSHAGICSPIVNTVVRAAYEQCEDWLDELLVYIKANIEYFVGRLNKEIPNLKTYIPDGTYLMWVDFNKTGKTVDELKSILVGECHLAFNNGIEYGPEGEGFFRVNLACPRRNVEETVDRLKKAFAK